MFDFPSTDINIDALAVKCYTPKCEKQGSIEGEEQVDF